MHDAKECCAWNIAGQAADCAALQIDLKSIAETLVHKRNGAVIWRDIRALSEVRQDLDLGREVFKRAAGLSLGECGNGEEKTRYSKWPKFHHGRSVT